MNALEKVVVVVMGSTGCGKSRLSIDLASKFSPSFEILNSDKMQIYRGLDITTNKVPPSERKDIPHNLLGEFDSSDAHLEFDPSDFRSSASAVVSEILSRRRIPCIVGGSNSFIYALLAEKFNPEVDVFAESNAGEDASVFCKEIRYRCCFLWIDVALPVLNQYLAGRVDDMLEEGMFEELAEYFQSAGTNSAAKCGLRKAIGVPEFEGYFKRFNDNNVKGYEWMTDRADEEKRLAAYQEAVRAVKDNTCKLAKRQRDKILRLRDGAGWKLNRLDATAVFRAAIEGDGRRVADIWETEVLKPSVKLVEQFVMDRQFG